MPQTKKIYVISAAMLLATLLASLLATPPACAQPQKVGGPCTYAPFPGSFTIVSVEPAAPDQASGLPFQPYQVLFTFAPSTPTSELAALAGKTHSLQLTSGAGPGPRFLQRYAIRPGAVFSGQVERIATGTCTPIVFRLEGVDTADLFEYTVP